MTENPSKTDQVEVSVQALVTHYGADPQTLEALLKVVAAVIATLPDDLFDLALDRALSDLKEMATDIRVTVRAH